MSPSFVDVLLVEDNPEDAELTIWELKRHRLANRIVHANGGEEALDFLHSAGMGEKRRDPGRLPWIILLDIQMPRTDGMEVLRRIKSDLHISDIPVVILTSSNDHPDIQKFFDLGAMSYIVKPLRFERFSQAIRNLGFYWLLLDRPPHVKENHLL